MTAMLSRAEEQRVSIAGTTARAHKSALGQFMTPAATAHFMANLFTARKGPASLLDAGAGLGALTCAVIDRWRSGTLNNAGLTVHAYELDDRIRGHLEETLRSYATEHLGVEVHAGDYLTEAEHSIRSGEKRFTHAILNPPYKKIGVASEARASAQAAGLTVVNLYAAFVGLALAQVSPGGELVAIIPRSFCNGPYYKTFRQWILDRAAVRHVHLFDSRTQAFKDDAVLQENVILLLAVGAEQGEVTLSRSTDDSFSDIETRTVPFEAVVRPNDPDLFFHVAVGSEQTALEMASGISTSLEDLGITVSTGPVVTFRTREHLLAMPAEGTVPMLYAGHFTGFGTEWPQPQYKKANAIIRNDQTERWLYPNGTYIVVRRMSSKEEKKRVVASKVTRAETGDAERLGLDNGLNFFHEKKKPLPDDLAWGLLVYLNSSAVDVHFRQFNGHTQVNATDLRNIPYPDRQMLMELGKWAKRIGALSQDAIDKRMEALLK